MAGYFGGHIVVEPVLVAAMLANCRKHVALAHCKQSESFNLAAIVLRRIIKPVSVSAILARGRQVLTIYGWTNPPVLILGRGVTLPPGH